MIDLFSLALCHGLLLLTAWRLMRRPDLDTEAAAPPPAPAAEAPRAGWGVRRA